MTDHLNEAREVAKCAQNWGSPDARSVPYALHGITHALIAIAEQLGNAAGTPRTAPRSDEDASRVPEGGSDPARPPESHRCDLEDGMPHRWVTGIPPVSWSLSWKMSVRELCGRHLGKRIRVDGWSGILTAVVHDHLGTDVSIEQDDGILCGCRRDRDHLCEVWL